MRLLVASFALIALAGCVGTPPADRIMAEAQASGVCEKLPEGVTCDCVVSTAQTLIPTMSYNRNAAEDTGSRLGRGTIGAADPRVAPALEAARESCAAGKAVG